MLADDVAPQSVAMRVAIWSAKVSDPYVVTSWSERPYSAVVANTRDNLSPICLETLTTV